MKFSHHKHSKSAKYTHTHTQLEPPKQIGKMTYSLTPFVIDVRGDICRSLAETVDNVVTIVSFEIMEHHWNSLLLRLDAKLQVAVAHHI